MGDQTSQRVEHASFTLLPCDILFEAPQCSVIFVLIYFLVFVLRIFF